MTAMAEPAPQPTEPANANPRAGRRRRGGWRPLIAAVALLALLGRGLGWFGGAPEEPADADPAEVEQVARERADGGAQASGQGGATDVSTPAPDERADAGAGAQRPAPPEDAPPPTQAVPAPDADAQMLEPKGAQDEAPAPTLDDDRFESLLSLVDLRLAEGELARAGASLAHLVAQPLSATQREVVGERQAGLDDARERAAARVVERLRAGEVLAAERAAARLLGSDDNAAVNEAGASPLARALAELDMAGDWRRAPALDDAPLPAARQLPRNQRVRLRWRDDEHVGAVATSSGEHVTVRVRTETGQSYPRVARVDCEPVDVAPADAIEMAIACLHAGRALRARLWYACAFLRGDGALDERGRMLGELLR